ncbi:serine hydrolase domain-containing protein [Gemmatimonas sp.]|uniref:serine hydrolase domain-containing protein n=1 Tax=Gemmatimonas sp. TaxID=1962908 RepID=UPI003983B857
MRGIRRTALVVTVWSMLTACSGADLAVSTAPAPVDPKSLPMAFPSITTDEWATITPADLGWDTLALRAALDWAGAQKSTAVVIAWRGRIVAERYWKGWTPSTDSIIASASKSVVSLLVGRLREQGRLTFDDPATRWLGASWSRAPLTESRITVKHLLSMSSGLDDSLKAVVEPNTRFYYNNPAYYQLFGVVATASGQSVVNYSASQLFAPIGMRTARWVPNIDTGELGLVLSCSARDMVRFGHLILNRGRWNGHTILGDDSYFAAALTTAASNNPSYGYLWWLNGKSSYRIPGPYVLPTLPGALIPSAPIDLIAALGKGDKKIYVIPSLDVVIARHGEEADVANGNPLALSAFDEQWWQRLRLVFPK